MSLLRDVSERGWKQRSTPGVGLADPRSPRIEKVPGRMSPLADLERDVPLTVRDGKTAISRVD
jgi:hypothetical protein